MPNAGGWGGYRTERLRAYFRTTLPAPCGRCGKTVHPDPPGTIRSGWTIGHVKDRSTHPELTWVLDNMRVEHASCSSSTGKAAADASQRAKGKAAAEGRSSGGRGLTG